MSEELKKCPGCGRHCDLSAPSCPRGEAYARGEVPAEAEHGESRRGMHGEHEHGRYGERSRNGEGRHGEHGFERGEGRHPHGGERRRGIVGTEEYQALDTGKKLGALLGELGFLGRGGMVERGGQQRVLRLLNEEDGMTQKVLTEKLGIQPGSVSELLGKLERSGLIEKQENEADRRTASLKLTDAGREKIMDKAESKESPFDALTAEEQQQLLVLLEKLHADWKARFHAEYGARKSSTEHFSRHEEEVRGEHRHGRRAKETEYVGERKIPDARRG